MLDRDLRDLGAMPAVVDRYEAVHLAIEPHVLNRLAAIGLERAAVVVQPNAGDPGDQPIGDAARQRAAEAPVLALLAPSRHDRISLVQLRKEPGDIVRIVL